MSPAYLILIVLIITGGLLTLLLLPLPNFGTRILLGLLHKLNSPLLFWPTRIVVGFVLISFFCTVDLQVFANLVVSITEMTKYESKLQDLHTDGLGRKDLLISKWRSERNFYLHCFAVVLLWYPGVYLC